MLVDRSYEIKRCFLLGKKVMTNLESMLKSRDITLPTKVRQVKAMVFPVVMYGFPGGSDGKASVYSAGDPGSSLGLGRSPGEGNGNPLQENPMDRGAW